MALRRSQVGDQGQFRGVSFPASAGIPTASHGLRSAPGLSPTSDARLLNAYCEGEQLVLVQRDAQGQLVIKQERAERSCFLSRADAPQRLIDRLRSHPDVADARVEGDWVRVRWVSREALAIFCASAAKDKIQTYEAFTNPVLRYMADRRIGVQEPRPIWVDIETDSRVPFSRKEEMRILCWATDDGQGNERTACLTADTDDAEAELLAEFWEAVDDYDLVLAWSGERFDFPVIVHRSIRVGLVGPRRIDPRRWLWLDHLELFRRMNMNSSESGDEKQSLKLDTVSRKFLGDEEGKLEFDAAFTWQEWAAGGARRRRLVDYCAQDTRLMPKLEQATGYVRLLFTLSDVCGTFPNTRGINPTVQVEGFLQRLALDRGHKFPTKPRTSYDTPNAPFKGAFVMEPKGTGIRKDVHVADFSGMYPNIIRSWNMSPETLAGMGARAATDTTSWSPLTGASFHTEKEGILCAAVAELIRLRKEWANKKASCAPGTQEWQDAERRSGAYKIATNSFYGVIGTPHGRFFDRRVAEAVTQCGAWLIHQTIHAAESEGMEVIYGDTDSIFVVGAERQQFEQFVERCNTELYPELLKKAGCKSNHITLAYEKQFKRLIISTAKKYAGSFAHYKGTDATSASKPEVKGLEYKRGDATRFARSMQEEIVALLVGYKQDASDDAEDYDVILHRWRERILHDDIALEDVLVSKRLGKPLTEYVRKEKKDGTQGRLLPHLELALQLQQQGLDMNEGAKVDYVIVDPEAKPQSIVAASEWDGALNRGALWRQQIAPPSLRLLEAAFPGHDWNTWQTEGSPKKQRAKKETQPHGIEKTQCSADPPVRRRKRSGCSDRSSDRTEPTRDSGASRSRASVDATHGVEDTQARADSIPRRRRRSDCTTVS